MNVPLLTLAEYVGLLSHVELIDAARSVGLLARYIPTATVDVLVVFDVIKLLVFRLQCRIVLTLTSCHRVTDGQTDRRTGGQSVRQSPCTASLYTLKRKRTMYKNKW